MIAEIQRNTILTERLHRDLRRFAGEGFRPSALRANPRWKGLFAVSLDPRGGFILDRHRRTDGAGFYYKALGYPVEFDGAYELSFLDGEGRCKAVDVSGLAP